MTDCTSTMISKDSLANNWILVANSTEKSDNSKKSQKGHLHLPSGTYIRVSVDKTQFVVRHVVTPSSSGDENIYGLSLMFSLGQTLFDARKQATEIFDNCKKAINTDFVPTIKLLETLLVKNEQSKLKHDSVSIIRDYLHNVDQIFPHVLYSIVRFTHKLLFGEKSLIMKRDKDNSFARFNETLWKALPFSIFFVQMPTQHISFPEMSLPFEISSFIEMEIPANLRGLHESTAWLTYNEFLMHNKESIPVMSLTPSLITLLKA